MSHCYFWHRTRNQRPLVRRATDVTPPQEPLGAEALDQVVGEGLGRIEALGDGLYIILCERKVLCQSLGALRVCACTKSTRHSTVETRGSRDVESLCCLLFVAAMQVKAYSLKGQDILDARAMLNLQRRGQRLRVLWDCGFDYVLSYPVARLDDESRVQHLGFV